MSMIVIYTGFVLTFILNGYLANHLNLEGLGDFRVAVTIATIIATLVIVGGQNAASRFIPPYFSEQKWNKTKGYIKHYIKLILVLSTLTLVLSLILVELLGRFGYEHVIHEAFTGTVLSPVIAFVIFFSALLRSMKRVVGATLPNEILKPALFLSGCIIYLEFRSTFNEYEAFFIFFMANLFVLSLQYFLIVKVLPF